MDRAVIVARTLRACVVLSALSLGSAMGEGLATGSEGGVATDKGLSAALVPFKSALAARATGKSAALRKNVFPSASSGERTQIFASGAAAGSAAGSLPLWTYDAQSSRDGRRHRGVMVGTSPFTNPGTSTVPVEVFPIRLRLHSIAASIDTSTFLITTAPGHATIDPSEPDVGCMGASNNIPATVLAQSPIFQSASFTFGSTPLGTTQYIDAIQRASFYNASAGVPGSYHVLLDPVRTMRSITIDVPAGAGIAITNPNFFSAFNFTLCGTAVLLDVNWFDDYVNDRLLPELAEQGVAPSNLPIFLLYNTWMGAPADDLNTCCILGYHSYGFGGAALTLTQTYAVADFDYTGFFGLGGSDTAVWAHEIGEWANDPYGINLVPPWGGTGQVSGCQSNLEVGDPLTGTTMPQVTMPNGFTYNLQELAFFSWYLGAPSIGANGWFSANDTFTTDAGTPCLLQ